MAEISYNESDIVVTKGLEGLRLRPSMYIGNIENGRFSILKEILDNALDEATAGYSSKVGCILLNDGKDTCIVYDEGRGIPVGPHPNEPEKSTLEIVFTQLHAGGKLKKGAYAAGSTGTHGVGSSATNALSIDFKAWTFRDGNWWTQSYSKGVPTSKVEKSLTAPIKIKKGTIVQFTPDDSILKKPLDHKQVYEYLENCSYLNSGVSFELQDKSISNDLKVFKSNGLIDFVKSLTYKEDDSKYEELGKPFIFKNQTVDVVLQWFESDSSNLTTWVNSNKTIEGGTHLNGLIRLINTAFGNFARKKNYKSEDLRVGLYGGLNLKIAEPQFDSQTKEKLINSNADKLVYDNLIQEFTKYLEKNKSFVKRIIDRANEMRAIYNKFANEKKALSKIKTKGKQALPPPSKFIVSNCKDDNIRELYLCEGESAGGSARQARDPHYQEILKLRGKIINSAKTTASKVYESEDIINILKAIGFDPVNKEHHPRVGKVIFLTDADVDGCLDGNTRILTLDGKNPTIKELTEKFEKDQQPFYVYSVDDNKNLVVGKAINPRITRTVDKLIELTLSNGEKIKCTLDHKWLVNNPDKNDPDLIWIGNLPYKLAKNLTEKDSIRSVYFEKRNADGNYGNGNHYQMILDGDHQGKFCNRNIMPVHRFVKNCDDPKSYHKYELLGRNEHIHHKDFNPENNNPENLVYLSQEDHGSLHMKEISKNYNGTEQQKRKVKIAWTQRKYKNRKCGLSKYNISEKHSQTVRNLNSNEEQKRLQLLGKCVRFFNGLLKNGLKINENTWNLYCSKKGIQIPRWETLKSKGISLKDIYQHKKRKNITGYYEITLEKNSYPQQKITKFNRIVKILEEKGLDINEENYENEKKLHERGVPHWKTIKNHRVISKRIIEETKEVYCMTVPKYHNFMVDDGNGNGICSANSHISTLLLTLIKFYYPELLTEGKVFALDAPLFIGKTKTRTLYGDNYQDLQKQAGKEKIESVTRLKGWGEASPSLLKRLAFDPETRQLIKINDVSGKDFEEFKKIVGEDTEMRKKLLEEL